MVRIRYADQKLLCLQWKCGLGLKMTLSVDARRGSAPCRWAFPGVLFIIKKMLERNFGNFEKKIILTTKTIPTMQRNKKTFKRQNIYIGICPQQTKRTVPLVCCLHHLLSSFASRFDPAGFHSLNFILRRKVMAYRGTSRAGLHFVFLAVSVPCNDAITLAFEKSAPNAIFVAV